MTLLDVASVCFLGAVGLVGLGCMVLLALAIGEAFRE